MLKLLNAASGPMSGVAEKLCLAGFMYLAGAGYIPAGEAVPLATAAYMLLSAGFTAVITSQTAKIQAINDTENGVKVVPATAPGIPIDHPLT